MPHNERLEFLGDAVLELVVTDYLYKKYMDKPEGELTAFRASLVNTNSISDAAIAYFLHVSFMHRNMGIVYGLDMIATFFLFYLSFAKTDARANRKEDWSTMLTSVALRLCQIQVCIIYAFSGWEKLKGMSWWKGEAIWTVFANAQIIRWQMNWVSHLPIVITIATYMTLLWEIYFPALIWVRRLRPWILVGGIALHLAIGLVVFIPYFSALMMLTYVCFLTPEESQKISRRIKPLFPFARIT
jgi:hypothetical protein